MSEKFKISQFKNNKKLKIINGKLERIPQEINGEIELYNLDKERAKIIKTEVFDKTPKDMTEAELTYMMIPYLCSIDMDISLDEFTKWIKNPPSTLFDDVIAEITLHLKDLYENIEEVNKKQDELKKLEEKYPEITKKIKTKDEILDELMQQLFKAKGDDKKRDEILKEITKVQNEK